MDPGTAIDGLRVISLLGAGGDGDVYLAEDVALGRRVALTILPEPLTADSGGLARFASTMRAAASLNHPNIAAILRSGVGAGRGYVAAELVEGTSVRARLQDGPLPLDEALGLAIQAAGALSAAHQAGLIHAGLRPERIAIRRRDGLAKVLDFGVASLGANPAGAAGGDAAPATLDYAAPEQAAGRADPRSDLYSLTVILYEMVTGTLPREAAARTPDGRANPGGERGALQRIFRRGLAADPAKRFQSAAEMIHVLDAMALRVTAAPIRIRQLIAAAVVIAAAAAAAVVPGRWWSRFAPKGPVRSVLVAPLSAGDPARPARYLEVGIADGIRSRLATLGALRVPSAASLASGQDPFGLAARLGIDAVVTGALQRSDDRVRVTLQLARTSDRVPIWSARFDEADAAIASVEGAAAERIAANVLAGLTDQDRALLARPDTWSRDAYDAYLRARDDWRKRTPQSIAAAIPFYEKAAAADPTYISAFAGLSQAYAVASSVALPTRHRLAAAAARSALDLDPRSSSAYVATAFIAYRFDHDWASAERHFRQALALNPRDPLASAWYGEYCALLGRGADAVEQFRRAVDAAPLSMAVRAEFVSALLNLPDLAGARTMLDESAAIDPSHPRIVEAAADVLFAEGRVDEAVEYRLRDLHLAGMPGPDVDALRAAYRSGGLRSFRRKRLDLLLGTLRPGRRPGPGVAAALALASADLHDKEAAIRWLNAAVDAGDDGAMRIRTRPFAFLRGDPRYGAIEARLGLR